MVNKDLELDRRQYVQLAGIAGLTGLAGCSGGGDSDGSDGSSDGSDGGSSELTLWAWNDQALEDIRDSQVETFAEQTGTQASWQYFPFDNYLTNLQTSLGTDSAPGAYATAVTWNKQLANGEQLLNLSQSDEIEIPELVDAAEQNVTFEGDIYAVPWYADCRALCINVDMFEEAGLEVPSDPLESPSWDQFAHWVNELSTESRAGYTMAPGEGFEGLMLSNGAGPYIEQISEGEFEVTFNDDEAIATGQYVMEDLGIDNISRADEDLEEFLAGNAAMTYAGSWEIGQLDDSDINYMYLPQPTGPDADEPSTWSAGVFYGVTPNASNEAMDWLEFILSTDQQQTVPDATGGFPGRADVYETDDFQEFVQSDPAIEVIAQEMQRTSPFPPIINVTQLLSEIGRPAIERVYQGQATPEEAFNDAAEQMVSELDQVVQE